MSEAETKQGSWWRRGVVYQVYIRSFADSTGNGTGDINGLRSRLSYLSDLGIDAIWVNPWYLSPLADGGYDVADYYTINPMFGTNDDADALISEAHAHGIRVIVDMVPNHTSDQHNWFRQAVSAPAGHPSRNRYHIMDGRGADGSEPPNNWTSVFGGPAWTRLADGQWYLHLFAPEQPDLNWASSEVRSEFLSVLDHWLKAGVDGFRVDVAHGLCKQDGYPDLEVNDDGKILTSANYEGHHHWDRDEIHDIVRDWRALVDSYCEVPGQKMMVAEAWVRPERVGLYLASDQYHQSFNFALLEAEWDATEWKSVIDTAFQAAVESGSTPTWVLSNHDVMREASRYGLPKGTDWRSWPISGPAEALDAAIGLRRARSGGLAMLGLPGSAYLYQGEELGLPEVWDLPAEVLDDPVWERSGHTQKGRDGCRVPVPWTIDGPSAGFGSGSSWLPQPTGWGSYSVEAQTGVEDSTLEMYRAALAARSEFGGDTLRWLDSPAGVLSYQCANLICVVNYSDSPVALPEHQRILVASVGMTDPNLLPSDGSVWLLAPCNP